MELTLEQRERMEKKKREALAKKRKREIPQQQGSASQPSVHYSQPVPSAGQNPLPIPQTQATVTPQTAPKPTVLQQLSSAPKPQSRFRAVSEEERVLATREEAVQKHAEEHHLEHLRREIDRKDAELMQLRAQLASPAGSVASTEATADLKEVIEEETKCRVCLDIVACAHMLACGHIYCYECIVSHIFKRSADTKIPVSALHSFFPLF